MQNKIKKFYFLNFWNILFMKLKKINAKYAFYTL